MSTKSDFTKLDSARSSHLERCRLCAEVTIPSTLPPDDFNSDDPLKSPFQSLGARGVNNLASKLLLTLMPPNEPIVKLQLPEDITEEIKNASGGQAKNSDIATELRIIEDGIIRYIEAQNHRTTFYRALKQLVVTGNTLLEFGKDGHLKAHKLSKYVLERSPSGFVHRIILREMVHEKEATAIMGKDIEGNDKGLVEVFTDCQYDFQTERWEVKQELGEDIVPDSEGSYKKQDLPYMAVVWLRDDEEVYGRGHVEQYLGDLLMYDKLSKAICEGSALASKFIFLLRRGSTIKLKDLKDANNGDVIHGDADDISCVGIEKDRDFGIALQKADRLEQELAKDYLMHTSIQRNAERVTAEEVRYMAQELEDGLGGIYSMLTTDLQLPYIRLIMSRMGIKLPSGIEPIIVTGFEALGRNHEIQKLTTTFQLLNGFLGEDVVRTWTNPEEVIKRVSNATRVDTTDLFKDQATVQQETEQQQQMAMVQQAVPQIAEMAKGQLTPTDGRTE